MASFRDKIFSIVKKIPKGKVLTYKEIAKLAGKPKAWRAVGNILAKNKNPFNCEAITRSEATGLKIPCHRVIGTDGKIGGYKRGIKKKIDLLKKEGIKFSKYGKIASRFGK